MLVSVKSIAAFVSFHAGANYQFGPAHDIQISVHAM